MDWWQWLAPSSILAMIGTVITIAAHRRARSKDDFTQWLVRGELSGPDSITVTVRPVGATPRDVRIALGVISLDVRHEEVAVATWPKDSPALEFAWAVPGGAATAGDMFVRIIFRSTATPGSPIEEWWPVFPSGRAARVHLQQESASSLRLWWRRTTGRPVLPEKRGVPSRVLTERLRRRELRRLSRSPKR